MSKMVVVLAMLLVQVQPVVGVALCQQHHQAPEAACMTGEGHGDHHAGHPAQHAPQQGTDQCAATAACTSALPAVPPPAVGLLALDAPASPGTVAAPVALATGPHTPLFHPPKS